MISFKIVGWLQSGASQIILPSALTEIAGLDYDIDSEYLIRPNIIKDSEGNLKVVKLDNTKSLLDNNRNALDNEFLRIAIGVMGDSNHLTEQLTSNNFDNLKLATIRINELTNKQVNNMNVYNYKDRSKLNSLNLNVRSGKGISVNLDGVSRILGNIRAKFNKGLVIKHIIKEDDGTVNFTLQQAYDTFGKDNVTQLDDNTVLIDHKYLFNNAKGDHTNLFGALIQDQCKEITSNILDAV
jgi:hypothetical protein